MNPSPSYYSDLPELRSSVERVTAPWLERKENDVDHCSLVRDAMVMAALYAMSIGKNS